MRTDRSKYSEAFGNSIADYVDFALEQNGYGEISTELNPISFDSTVLENNRIFGGLDKSKGDNIPRKCRYFFRLTTTYCIINIKLNIYFIHF